MREKIIPEELKTWTTEKWGSAKLPIGGTVPFHSSFGFKTGDWSALKPIINKEKCTGCTDCFYFCPDSAIEMIGEGKKLKAEVDFDYCKGCSVCAQGCRFDAIEMKEMR
ncbi:MAG: 4Fe-4S binding protein [Candidatus Heimdallarchaeota archaeon]|nr:4Fe-4S binding protein [Candidatus Heimdallarchaeota archaeon]